MRLVVTGGAGFIGSNLVDTLIRNRHEVVVIDNFTTGTRENLATAAPHDRCTIVEADLVHAENLRAAFAGAEAVFHFAANADVRFGWDDPRRDLDQNVIATLNVLEAARAEGVRRILFSSTGSVYGEAEEVPTPEDTAFPRQTSLYGASKVAAEGYLAAYAEAGHITATVFRFVSLLGPRYSHGHVIDFVRQLTIDPTRLHVLGDGTQRKSYLDVDDCIEAMLLCLPRTSPYEVFNLGTDEYCTVRESAGWICDRLGVSPDVTFGIGDRGWIGDNPFIFLDTARIRSLGWSHQRSIRQAVERTVDDLRDHPERLGVAAEAPLESSGR